MRIAITGGTGFVGRHLARRLAAAGHEVVIISRGVDKRDEEIRHAPGATFKPVGTGDVQALTQAFEGCDAVAHLGGINREIGTQTYASVHVQGTANVIKAAETAGVKKLLLLSFLRARPDCGSPYHESKWAAEELIRGSGLDYTIFKAGVIYGRGDHMLDHISHALHTFPIFLLVGFRPKAMRPLAVDDLTFAMEQALTAGRLARATVPISGPEEMDLRELARRIARTAGTPPAHPARSRLAPLRDGMGLRTNDGRSARRESAGSNPIGKPRRAHPCPRPAAPRPYAPYAVLGSSDPQGPDGPGAIWLQGLSAARPKRRRRSELRITETLEKAIAPAATIGLSCPIAAIGIATTL